MTKISDSNGGRTRVPLLEVASLAKSFSGIHAVRNVSFRVDRGDLVAMIGPNGAGKTTCFNLIHGELRADAGDVRFDGRSILGMATHAIARLGVGRTFQVAATFASMTVREAGALALAAHEGRDHRALSAMLRVDDPRIDALLARVGVNELARVACAALSYGDAKRVELALALAADPQLLLMDEPTSGMTPRARRELMLKVTEIAKRERIAVLFTEHDMDIVFGFAQRVIVLDRGAILAQGAPAAVRADPKVQAAYLGDPVPS